MTAAKTRFIDHTVEEYIREKLYNIMNLNELYEDFRRDADALRGALDIAHHIDKIDTSSYIFLLNFIQWTETNFCGFSWEQQQSYMRFHDMMLDEMEEKGWFEDEGDI